VTNNGATVNDSGKIGKCYQLGQNKKITSVIDIHATPISASCWIYLDSFQGTCDYILSLNSSSGYADQCIAIALESATKIVFCVGGSSGCVYNNSETLVGKWTHLTVTFDGSKIKGYLNGVEVCSLNSTASLKRSNLTLGCRNGSATYYTTCKLNDVRIYDHCLSPKEIKEISKGLVLHYCLDVEPINLVPFKITTENYTQSNYSNRTSSTISDFVYHVDGLQSETPQDTSYTIRSTNYVTLPSNTTVYLSFHCKGKNSTNLFFGTSGYNALTRLIDSSNNAYFPQTQVIIGTEFDRWVVLAITTGSSTQYKIQIGMDTPNLYGIGSYIEYRHIMISTEIPRNYVPYMGGVMSVYDSSGYRNDANVNGKITPIDDSPRYVCSASFNGTSYIQLTSPSAEVRSISFWAKWNSIPSGQSIVFVDYKSKIGFGLMSTGILCSTSGISTHTFSKSNIVANTWYHFVIVNTGTTSTSAIRDLYINGVKQTETTSSSSSNWTYSLDYLQLGKRSTTSDGFSGKISDFRMYTTALSEDDIKELYDTAALIDNSHNMHCYEFVEDDVTSPMIEKNGLVKTNEFNEYPDDYIFYDYIESSGTQWIDTGIKANQDTVVEIEFEITGNETGYGAVLGARTNASSNCFYVFTKCGNGKICCQVGNSGSKNCNTSQSLNVVYNLKVSNGNITVNGDSANFTPVSDFETPLNVRIFNIANANTSSSGTGNRILIGKVYSFKLYDSNIIVRNMIPAKRKSDNEIGMYDMVTGRFFGNSGTGTFTTGTAIDVAAMYEQKIDLNQLLEI
jgi:hypothetical protein